LTDCQMSMTNWSRCDWWEWHLEWAIIWMDAKRFFFIE